MKLVIDMSGTFSWSDIFAGIAALAAVFALVYTVYRDNKKGKYDLVFFTTNNKLEGAIGNDEAVTIKLVNQGSANGYFVFGGLFDHIDDDIWEDINKTRQKWMKANFKMILLPELFKEMDKSFDVKPHSISENGVTISKKDLQESFAFHKIPEPKKVDLVFASYDGKLYRKTIVLIED